MTLSQQWPWLLLRLLRCQASGANLKGQPAATGNVSGGWGGGGEAAAAEAGGGRRVDLRLQSRCQIGLVLAAGVYVGHYVEGVCVSYYASIGWTKQALSVLLSILQVEELKISILKVLYHAAVASPLQSVTATSSNKLALLAQHGFFSHKTDLNFYF